MTDPLMPAGGDTGVDNIYVFNNYICTDGIAIHVASQTAGDNTAHELILSNVKDYTPATPVDVSTTGVGTPFASASNNSTSFQGNSYTFGYASRPVGEEIVGTIERLDHNNQLFEDGDLPSVDPPNGDDQGEYAGWAGTDDGPSGPGSVDGDQSSGTDGSSFDDVLQTDQVPPSSSTPSFDVTPDPTTSTVEDCVIEQQAPQTTASFCTGSETPTTSPACPTAYTPDGTNGWYVTDPTVYLAPHLVYWNGGAVTTYYSKDGGTTTSSSGPPVPAIPFSTDGTYPFQYHSEDSASDVETTHSVTVKVDTTAPNNIVLTTAGNPITAGETFDLSPPAPTCTAQDATSGVLSCVVTNNPTTPQVGSNTATGKATDYAGNTASQAVTYSVLARWPGFSQPINDPVAGSTPMSQFKAGSTIPVKFQILNASNAPIQAQTVPVFSYQQVSGADCATSTTTETTTATTADTSSTYRYDTTAQQYIYNWSTKGLSGGCYQVNATFTHGVQESVILKLK